MINISRAHGIMFHHFCDDRHPRGQGAISADELAAMIRFLGQDRILSAQEWMRRALENTLQPEDLCFTFDDGLRCQYEIARPVLEDFGIKAFWFVYSSILEGSLERMEIYRYFRTTHFADVDDFYAAFFDAVITMKHSQRLRDPHARFDPRTYLVNVAFYSENDRHFRFVRDEVLGPAAYQWIMDAMIERMGLELKELAADLWLDAAALRDLHATNHVIGLHSHTHPTRIVRMTDAEQRREYTDNHSILTRVIGCPPLSMSHPCNSYNSATLEVLRRLGIRLGFRANLTYEERSELEWPREDHSNVMRALEEEAA